MTKQIILKLAFFVLWPIYLLVCAEGASFILAKFKLIPFVSAPLFYQSLPSGHVEYGEWRNELFDWGAWHKPSATASHEGNCFSVKYQSNAIGARDKEFNNDKMSGRVVLLGDSFAEGFAVNEPDTAASIIETRTGLDVYNFGAGGGTGPVQYDIIYDQLAKNYAHDFLVIFFLPENDFNDNDYEHWKILGYNKMGGVQRYRPYWRKTSGDAFDYFIPEDAVKSADFNWSSYKPVRAFFRKYFWSYNVYETAEFYSNIYSVSRQSGVPMQEILNNWKGYSGYFDATDEQQRAAIWFLDKIMAHSPAKKVIVVSIPSRSDYTRLASGADIGSTYWNKALSSAGQRLNRDIVFIDLLKYPASDPNSLFLPCDAHWSANGNAFAAEKIIEYLK